MRSHVVVYRASPAGRRHQVRRDLIGTPDLRDLGNGTESQDALPLTRDDDVPANGPASPQVARNTGRYAGRVPDVRRTSP